MATKRKILFVSQEMMPYMAETEIAKLSRYLPQAVQKQGNEIRSFIPRYGCVSERRNQLHEVIRLSGTTFNIGGADHPLIIKVSSIPSARMQVYLIDSEDYFKRKEMLFDEQGAFFDDNDERTIFFARGTLETIKKLCWQPDLIHCHGWFSMMVPLLVKKVFCHDPILAKAKIVVSVYNEKFSEHLSPLFNKKMMLSELKPEDVAVLSGIGYVELMKFALSYADGVVVGSQHIDAELQKHIDTLSTPVLPYKEGQFVEPYLNFYETITTRA
ncbi:MAG: glycogen/starch synthase [Prevotellaceae bacterium]|jgi:starch synthase|nr:glycogen/starch synthase [Prevotellaceae bacterium]